MTKSTRVASATLAVACLLTSACATGGAGRASGDRGTSGATPASSTRPAVGTSSTIGSATTTTTTATADANQTAVIASVNAFWKKVDELEANPKGDLTTLDLVARGQQLAQWQYNIGADRQRGHTGRGGFAVLDPIARATVNTRSYEVQTCLDGTDFTLVDKLGKTVPTPVGAPKRVAYRYGVNQDSRTLKWYVATEKALGTC